jgi:hypothetical protein
MHHRGFTQACPRLSRLRPSDTRPLQPQLQAGQASTRDVLKCALKTVDPKDRFAAISDDTKLPGISELGRQKYRRFLAAPSPRAFAIALSGHAWAWNSSLVPDAASRALARCAERAGDGLADRGAADVLAPAWHRGIEPDIIEHDQQLYENYGCGSPRNSTPAIAIPSSNICSIGNQWKPTRERVGSWCGRSKESWQRTGPPDHLLQPLRLLLAAAGIGLDDDGQQYHQQLAHGGRLARQINGWTETRTCRSIYGSR